MDVTSLPFDELKTERERLAALYNYNILDTPHEIAYDSIVKVAAYVCQSPISLMSLVDKDRQWFKSKVGFDVEETSRDISFCSQAIEGNGIFEIQDASNDERFRDNPLVTEDPHIRFYAGSPLVTKDGHKLGTLCVIDNTPKTLTPEQKECLETLSKQIMAQMELSEQKLKLQGLNNNLLENLKDRIDKQEEILRLFTRFVPEEVVAKHLDTTGEVDDAEAKHLTIMFCDIRGYTSIIEKLAPRNAVYILRAYYNILSEVITTFSGMVNQYVGDEIFATFGSPFSFPTYERNAVFCALVMIQKLEELNETCRPYTDIPIQVGIGIHSGEVITGTLGSKYKIEYAVTGDSVNTAKRIESLTRDHPNKILISKPVYDKVKDLVEVKAWPPMELKGKTEPMEVFEVISKSALAS